MDEIEFWKNFNMGIELNVAGSFIYDGLLAFDEMETFYHEHEVFGFLYNISVGIERLEKIAITLIEHQPSINQEEFERSLITHNHIDLFKRIEEKKKINVGTTHYKFLNLLTSFYKSMRYDRFSLKEVRDYDKEKKALIQYIFIEELKKPYSEEMFQVTTNEDNIKKFIGNVVGKISNQLYDIISEESHRLNIYTYELEYNSKAAKIFLAHKYNFIDERDLIKELLIFMINAENESANMEVIKSISPLNFDQALTKDYIECFLNKLKCQEIIDEAESLYEEVEDKRERIELLNLITSDIYSPDDNDFEDDSDEDTITE